MLIPAQVLDQLVPDFPIHKTALFIIPVVGVCLFLRFF